MEMETVKIMNAHRVVVVAEFPSDIWPTIRETLELVQAEDGLFLPKCDLQQYEAGRRPIAKIIDKRGEASV